MDAASTILSDLPPLKRLRLQHQQLQHQSACSPLPAKKRKESRNAAFHENPNPNPNPPSPSPPPSSATVYSLPAKKRVCALQPHLPSNDAISPFDLNVEYNPYLEPHETAGKIQFFAASPHKPQQPEEEHVDGDGNSNDCNDDDDGILCCVCQSTDGDPADPIVLCDGCDLMVHASCYGNPLSKGVPEGDWFCERCRFKDDEHRGKGGFSSCSCCLCPVKEGAMKRTTDQRWAHIVCAVLVPEVFFRDPKGREGIDCSKVPRKRWSEMCYVCGSCDGCAVVCSEPKCCLAFHITCGLKEELCIEYKEGKKGATVVAGFCKSHTQLWEKVTLIFFFSFWDLISQHHSIMHK